MADEHAMDLLDRERRTYCTILLAMIPMQFFQVDDDGRLFISPAIREWDPVASLGIDTVIDMDGGLDDCIPTTPEGCLYVYFPIYDEELPPLTRLHAVATLGAELIRGGHRILSHCGMGFNRSALVAAMIMHKMGTPGHETVSRIRARRPGALFNEVFADFLTRL
jgi:hypothetical protein